MGKRQIKKELPTLLTPQEVEPQQKQKAPRPLLQKFKAFPHKRLSISVRRISDDKRPSLCTKIHREKIPDHFVIVSELIPALRKIGIDLYAKPRPRLRQSLPKVVDHVASSTAWLEQSPSLIQLSKNRGDRIEGAFWGGVFVPADSFPPPVGGAHFFIPKSAANQPWVSLPGLISSRILTAIRHSHKEFHTRFL